MPRISNAALIAMYIKQGEISNVVKFNAMINMMASSINSIHEGTHDKDYLNAEFAKKTDKSTTTLLNKIVTTEKNLLNQHLTRYVLHVADYVILAAQVQTLQNLGHFGGIYATTALRDTALPHPKDGTFVSVGANDKYDFYVYDTTNGGWIQGESKGEPYTLSIPNNFITNLMMADNSVGTNQILNNSIIDAKIALEAITTNKIKNGAIITDKIADDAITNTKILNGAVGHWKIANSAVHLNNMGLGAVDRNALARNAVATVKIIDKAITTSKIADKAITNAKIANKTITGIKIQRGTIVGSGLLGSVFSHITRKSINYDDIADGGITNKKIADKTITAAKMADGVLSSGGSGAIADGSITTAKIANKAITFEKIADAAISDRKIHADGISINKIKGQVPTAKIADGAIDNDKLAIDAVDSDEIIDRAITTDKVGDKAITSAKIADKTITTDNIRDEAITNIKIADKAVTHSEIADGTIDIRNFNQSLKDVVNFVKGIHTQKIHLIAVYAGAGKWTILGKSDIMLDKPIQHTIHPSEEEFGIYFKNNLLGGIYTLDFRLLVDVDCSGTLINQDSKGDEATGSSNYFYQAVHPTANNSTWVTSTSKIRNKATMFRGVAKGENRTTLKIWNNGTTWDFSSHTSNFKKNGLSETYEFKAGKVWSKDTFTNVAELHIRFQLSNYTGKIKPNIKVGSFFILRSEVSA